LLFGSVLLLGCSKQNGAQTSAPGAGDKIKIGFVVKQPEEPWFQLEWKFAQQAADKDGFELIKIAAPDGEKALGAIDNLAASGAQGFVICTPDVKLGPAIVAKAQNADLKVIAVDDQFIGSDGKPMTDVPYLGISARKIGQSVGQALIDEMKKRNWSQDDTGVCVITFDELDTAHERTEGAIEAMEAAGFPENRIFKAPQKTSDVPGAFDAANILLTQHPEVKRWLICGMNDSAVLGAVRATEGRGFNADNVIGIGINGTDCIAEFEKPAKTGFYASVLLQAKLHGYQTADMMYNWIKNGAEPPRDTRTIGVLIDRDNFQRVLKDQGIR
jgi:L-arabinose transport system substrate-binding protein